MNIAGMEVYFASDLKSYGYTEDGEEFVGEVFFVEVEDAKGNRWRHQQKFDGVRVQISEWGAAFLDKRDWARRQCEQLVANINKAGRINLDRWSQARPAYGSEAYIDYGQAEDVALEREKG